MAIEKFDSCENINSVNRLYLNVNHASGHIDEKMGINILFLVLQTKRYFKNSQTLGWD